MFYERLSSTEKYNMSTEHPHNLESSRWDLEQKYGKSEMRDLFKDDDDSFFSSSSSGEGLSMQPIVDLIRLGIWCYSTPVRAVVTSTTVFFASIHFGWISLPVIAFKIMQWAGIGMVATSTCLGVREVVIKINGKAIENKEMKSS